jgi:signal peptidase I
MAKKKKKVSSPLKKTNKYKDYLVRVSRIFVVDFIETVAVTLAIALLIYIFIASPHVVVGKSMMPNFINGEYLFTNKLVLSYSNPVQGQVIVFQHTPQEEYIKRVIATPGETLELKNGNVYINGKRLNESAYIPKGVNTNGATYLANNVPLTIPKGEYFVMGDNRGDSSDSRFWGLVPRNEIKGVASFIFWPLNRFGFVPQITYTTKGNVIYSTKN